MVAGGGDRQRIKGRGLGELVEFPGNTHSLFNLEPERVLAEIQEFVTGARGPIVTDRILATVLFLDVVSSTERAAQTRSAIPNGAGRSWRMSKSTARSARCGCTNDHIIEKSSSPATRITAGLP